MDLEALKIDRGAPSAKRKAPTPGQRGSSGRRSPWFGRLVCLAVVGGLIWLFRAPLMRLIDRWTLPSIQVTEAREPSRGAAGAIRGTAANGYVVAARRAALSADTPGRVVELNVEEGSQVAKGDVVARLFFDEFAAAVERAKADVGVAAAEVTAAESRLAAARVDLDRRQREVGSSRALQQQAEAEQTLAARELERVEPLVAGGFSSQGALDQAIAERDRAVARVASFAAQVEAADAAVAQAEAEIARAQADVATARARVGSAQATLTQAEATLDKTYVRAPFDGIVVLKDAELGEVVSPNSQGGSNARGSICTMVDRDSLEVQVELPESSLSDIEVDKPATVFLDAYPDDPYPGRVDRIWPTANRQKATVEIRVALDRRDDRLRPDMGLRVVFGSSTNAEAEPDRADEPQEPVLLIPSTALIEVDGQRGVFAVEQDRVRFVEVDVAATKGASAAIRNGLRKGQRIAASPPPSLRPGDRVLIEDR